MILFEDGEEKDRIIGAASKNRQLRENRIKNAPDNS
jgi:hypothetical protein